MAKIEALLRDQAGFERTYAYEVKAEDAGSQEFMWTDGNYACDCNRSLMLYEDKAKQLDCGNTILCLSLKVDGKEVHSESPQ